jgi:hypothetical protein
MIRSILIILAGSGIISANLEVLRIFRPFWRFQGYLGHFGDLGGSLAILEALGVF